MTSAHTAFRLQQLRAKGTVQKEAGVGKVVVKEKEPGAKEKNASGSTGPSEGLVKPSQDASPSSLQSATTVTRHTGGGGTTPTKKVLPPNLQLPTLPALPGASDSATAAKSVTAEVPSKSVQPEAPSQAARTSVSIAPEPDEVVIVSTSTVTTVGQPPRLQQRKGINLGFCRNQEGFNFTGHCFYLLAFLGSLVLICFLMLWMD